MARAYWLGVVLLWSCWVQEISSSCALNYNNTSSTICTAVKGNITVSNPVCRNKRRSSRWRQTQDKERGLDVTHVDSALLPDYWSKPHEEDVAIDPRIRTNGEAPEQLVKVTDRRHRHPVFATVCSLAFLLTIIGIIVICTQ